MYTYKQGDIVLIEPLLKTKNWKHIRAKICGVGPHMSILGQSYIFEPIEPNKDYGNAPYTHWTCFESQIKSEV